MTISPQERSADSPASFEQALTELEGIVHSMEQGAMSLEDSLAAYQRGIALLRACQDQLAAAEQKIRVLENGVMRDLPVPADDESV